MKAGVPESRRRREGQRGTAEAKAADPTKTRSVLATLLRQPTPRNAQELVRIASQGGLTTHDMQAGIAAIIAGAAQKLLKARKPKTGEKVASRADVEQHRQSYVLLKQLIEGLKDVVLDGGGDGGPVVLVELHWPTEFAGVDHGEDVRLRVEGTP